MRQMLPPTYVREVKSFIGMCSDYRGSIPNFSAIVNHIIRLTKKFAKCKWNKECQAAFDFVIEILTTVTVLAYPDTSKSYIPYIDVDCIKAWLMPRVEYTRGDEIK